MLPEGRLAALNYAWLVMMLPLGIFGMSIGDAIFPTFANLAAQGRTQALAWTSSRMLGLVLFLTVPSAVLLAIAGRPFVAALLERNAFTAESTAITVAALSWYALGLPAHAALEILTRSFFALYDTRTPVVAGALAMVSYVALALLFVGRLEHVALAMALSAVTTVEAVVLFVLLQTPLAQSRANRSAGVAPPHDARRRCAGERARARGRPRLARPAAGHNALGDARAPRGARPGTRRAGGARLWLGRVAAGCAGAGAAPSTVAGRT